MFLDKYGSKKILVYSLILNTDQQQPLQLLNSKSKMNVVDSNVNLNITTTTQNITASNNNSTRRGLLNLNHHKHLESGGGNTRRNNKLLTDDHRFTSLEHTLIDVLIAAHSKNFKPGIYSSLSDLVSMFGNIGKKDRQWCQG